MLIKTSVTTNEISGHLQAKMAYTSQAQFPRNKANTLPLLTMLCASAVFLRVYMLHYNVTRAQ